MQHSWKLALPAALALMVAGCATNPAPMPMSMPTPVAAVPIVPPPSASVTVPESDTAPVRPNSRRARIARARTAPTANTEQTTAGPSAIGRAPASAQPTGNGGS